MDVSDEELMARYQAGDKPAVETIYLRYKYRILNFCWRMLGNRAQAEDAASEIFMSLFTSAYKMQSDAKFSTWLYTIARNHCVNVLRRRSRETACEIDRRSDENSDATLGTRDALLLKESESHLRAALEQLSEEQKQAIVLQHYEGLSYSEIAAVLGCSLDKVKVLIFRAKENLSVQLAFLLKEGQS